MEDAYKSLEVILWLLIGGWALMIGFFARCAWLGYKYPPVDDEGIGGA